MIALRERGFTLLELLVTMVIMVAIVGLAVPQFSRAMLNIQLRESTQEIAALLRHAKNTAVTQSKLASVVLQVEGNVLQPDFGKPAYKWPNEISVEAVNNVEPWLIEDTVIRFYPDGTASQAVLTVSAQEKFYTVSVDWLTGRIRVR